MLPGSLSRNVNAVAGEGLQGAFAGADSVVDVSDQARQSRRHASTIG
jgi:hypothetical protein